MKTGTPGVTKERLDHSLYVCPLTPIHRNQYIFRSKKGEISLTEWFGKLYLVAPWEIYSWDALFPDVERFASYAEAEARIMELLA